MICRGIHPLRQVQIIKGLNAINNQNIRVKIENLVQVSGEVLKGQQPVIHLLRVMFDHRCIRKIIVPSCKHKQTLSVLVNVCFEITKLVRFNPRMQQVKIDLCTWIVEIKGVKHDLEWSEVI